MAEPSQAQLLRQIDQISKREENKTCAECAQRESCWAVIIHPPVRGGAELGIFCCGRCYKTHSLLGAEICVVKSLSMATEWTVEEVNIFDRSGNELVNAVYEAKLSVGERNSEKEIVTFDQQEEARVRSAYISKKYKEHKYFSQEEYGTKMRRIKSRDNSNNNHKQERAEVPRGNRRAMLMGGSLSVRNLPSEDSPKTRSTAVLERAASQRRGVMRKSNSDRDLMGRLNGISLAGSKPSATGTTPSRTRSLFTDRIQQGNSSKDECNILHNLETSSTKTANTESSDCSSDLDPTASQASPAKQPQHAPLRNAEKDDADDINSNNKRPIRKTTSMEESVVSKTIRDSFQKASNDGNDQEEEEVQARPPLFSTIRKSPSGPSLFSAVMGTSGYADMDGDQKRPSVLGAASIASSARSMMSAVMGGGSGREDEVLEASQSRSPDLMQLPCTLRTQKTSATSPGEGDPRLRKALSSRNLMSGEGGGHSRVRRVLSARHPVSSDPMQSSAPEPPEMMRSRSQDSLNVSMKNNLSSHLEAASAMGSMRKTLSKPSLIDAGGSDRTEGASVAASTLGSNESPLQAFLEQQQKNVRKSPSGKNLMGRGHTQGNSPPLTGGRPRLGGKSMSVRHMGSTGRAVSRSTNSWSDVNNAVRNDPMSDPQSGGTRNWSATDAPAAGARRPAPRRNVMESGDNLAALGGGNAARKLSRHTSPNPNNEDAPLPIIKKSLSGRNLMASVGNVASKSAMRNSPSGKSLLASSDNSASRPMMRKALSGRNLMASVGRDTTIRSSKMHSSFNALNSSLNWSFNAPTGLLNNARPKNPRSSQQKPTRTISIGENGNSTLQRVDSIGVEDLGRQEKSVLCPTRRDQYDPDAAGLALLLEDSDPSMKNLMKDDLQARSQQDDSRLSPKPMRRQGSSRQLSSGRSPVSPKTAKLSGEESSNNPRDAGDEQPRIKKRISHGSSPRSPSPRRSSEECREMKRSSSNRSLSPCRSDDGSLSPRQNSRSAKSPTGSRESSSSRCSSPGLSPGRNSQSKAARTCATPSRRKSNESPIPIRPTLKKSTSMRNPKFESRCDPSSSSSNIIVGSTDSSRDHSKRDSGHRSWQESASSCSSGKSGRDRRDKEKSKRDSGHRSWQESASSKRDSGHRSWQESASSCSSGKSSRDRRDKDRNSKSSRPKREEESDRKSRRKSSGKNERRSSKGRMDGSETDTERKESARIERRRSQDYNRRDKKSGDKESRHSKHNRSSCNEEDRVDQEVERFIASVGDLNDENFWDKMMNKWEEAAE